MTNKNNIKDTDLIINDFEIPLDSNLGLLAYGDIAFTAWRKLKQATKKDQNEAK